MSRAVEHIPRISLAWLLVAQMVILAPHVVHLPLWLAPVWLVIVLWRIQIYRGSWSFPRWPVKLLLVIVTSIGLIATYRHDFGVETMVGMLAVGFVLKLVELQRQRDLFLVSYLGYFVAATQFLFHSGILAAFYGFFSLAVVTATVMATNQSVRNYRFWRTFRLTGVLLLQAFPLMLVLFMVVPRVGSLWTVSLNTSVAQTGISDSMSPGDISQLMRSNAVAFRATFEGDVPPHRDLYWRALAFSEFDGRTWSRNRRQLGHVPHSRPSLDVVGRETSYQVMLEPTMERWLFSLDVPVVWDDDVFLSRELTLVSRRPAHQRIRYDVTSALDYRYEVTELPADIQREELQLDGNNNPETRRLARAWASEADSTEALIKRFLEMVNREFRYTLQPPGLGRHSVDEFLWGTRAGFCEHFSSAFAFFMRAAGVPTRVVVGYQGGVVNPHENYLTVRQRHAHAWNEVWLEGRGWVRIDPTAAVAPERVEQGVDFSLDDDDVRLIRLRFGNDLFNQALLRWDVINYRWNMLVMGYDADVQEEFFKRWLGGTDPWRIAGALLVLGACSVLLVLGYILWRQRRRDAYPADRHYRRFCRRLAKVGLPRRPGEAPRDYAARVAVAKPEWADLAWRISRCYEQANYADDPAAMMEMERLLARFRPV